MYCRSFRFSRRNVEVLTLVLLSGISTVTIIQRGKSAGTMSLFHGWLRRLKRRFVLSSRRADVLYAPPEECELLVRPSGTGEATLYHQDGTPFFYIDQSENWVWNREQAGDFVRLEYPKYQVICEIHDIPKAIFQSVLPLIWSDFTLANDKFSAMEVMRRAVERNYCVSNVYLRRGDVRKLALVLEAGEKRAFLVTTEEVHYIMLDKSTWPVTCVVNKGYMFFDAHKVYLEKCSGWEQKGMPLYDKEKHGYPQVERGSQFLFRVHEMFNDLAVSRMASLS